MARVIGGDGPAPSDYMIVGERPGHEEAQEGYPFVGPAGQELWERIWRVLHLTREAFYVTNLVKTFSKKAPSAAEIASWAPMLQMELQRVRPKFILAVGAHAARWLLPQFADTKQDFFHGLGFPFTYGKLRPRSAVVVPCVHPSAALRQPDLYQNSLTTDLASFRDIIAGTRGVHQARRLSPFRIGLAEFGKDGMIVGVDTEGWKGDPQAVSLAHDHKAACLIETHDGIHKMFLRPSLLCARALAIWHAKHDWQVLAELGIDLNKVRVDDPMLQAYLLQLPQSLKVFAYRELGIEMVEYDDLVAPLDHQRVQSTLEESYERFRVAWQGRTEAAKRVKARYRNFGNRTRAKRKVAEAVAALPLPKTASGQEIPKRAVSGLARFTKVKAGAEASETPLRKRWQKSRFRSLVPLPPPVTWKDVPAADRVPYALTDAVAHLRAFEHQRPLIRARGLSRIYEIDRGIIGFLARNEQIGLACYGDELRQLSADFLREYGEKCDAISTIAGRPINPMAGEQVSDVLFKQLRIAPTKILKSGFYTTQDKYLKARKKAHPAVQLVIDARQLNKYRGTYTERLPGLLTKDTAGIERYHPDWKYTRTASGRAAESIILLIPKHSERGKKIRNCFHSTEGHALVSCDLSQIEMRVMAHESHDRLFMRAFERGIDMHAMTAHELLGAPKRKEDQDESLHRLPAKTLNFGVLMGMTEYGLTDQLQEQGQLQWLVDVTEELKRQGFKSTREFLANWFRVYKGVACWVDQQKAICRRRGYVTDFAGRRRYLSAIWSTDERVQREAERQAHATPIQSGAQVIVKLWIARIYREIILRQQRNAKFYCEPWVWVHDDVTLETDARIAKLVRERMLQLVPDILDVPTKADGKIGERWGSLH